MSKDWENRRPGDADLKRLFQEMRALDQARAPGFAEMMERAQSQTPGESAEKAPPSRTIRRSTREEWKESRTWRRLGWAGGLLAAAAVATILLLPPGNGVDARFEHAVRAFAADPAGGAWRSPTDGLLKLPGQAMLTTLPSIGGTDWPGGLGSGSGRHQH